MHNSCLLPYSFPSDQISVYDTSKWIPIFSILELLSHQLILLAQNGSKSNEFLDIEILMQLLSNLPNLELLSTTTSSPPSASIY